MLSGVRFLAVFGSEVDEAKVNCRQARYFSSSRLIKPSLAMGFFVPVGWLGVQGGWSASWICNT